ncbi:hypothetical protein [Qipengyuania nanhaisediminis]|uniref:hypothetical protein n=1 Tax=Qipengyuania nanhaisediminis TaxID=604088 RepID=UPI0038B3FD0F
MAIAGAAIAIPGAASAGVVVKSTGPSASEYPVGRQVADGSRVVLRAGDRITVLTDRGTSVMEGPGTFRIGEGARPSQRFSRLTRRGARARPRTGAVRGTPVAPETAPARSLWTVNLSVGGPVCLYDMDAIQLWRPAAEGAETYSIVDIASDTALDVTFVGAELVRELDQDVVSIKTDTDYAILSPASGRQAERSTVNVRFVQFDGDYGDSASLAQALLEKGCTEQFALLADTLDEEAS